jgi:hypothetical protein
MVLFRRYSTWIIGWNGDWVGPSPYKLAVSTDWVHLSNLFTWERKWSRLRNVVLNRNIMMDKVQKVSNCVDLPSSQILGWQILPLNAVCAQKSMKKAKRKIGLSPLHKLTSNCGEEHISRVFFAILHRSNSLINIFEGANPSENQ